MMNPLAIASAIAFLAAVGCGGSSTPDPDAAAFSPDAATIDGAAAPDGSATVDVASAPDATEKCDDFLYAAIGQIAEEGNLYRISLCDGDFTVTPIGLIGHPVTGLAFTSDGTLYGVTATLRLAATQLITVDPETGAGTSIAEITSSGVDVEAVPDLTAVGAQLYGWYAEDNQIMPINRTTGTATPLGPSATATGGAIAANATGTVYGALNGGQGPLHIIDVASGATSFVATLAGPIDWNLCALTFHDGQLYGVQNGPATLLVRIDVDTGAVTTIGTLPELIDALASPTP
jgi:hypothetical protein